MTNTPYHPPRPRRPFKLNGCLILILFLAVAVVFALVVKPWERTAVFGDEPQDSPAGAPP